MAEQSEKESLLWLNLSTVRNQSLFFLIYFSLDRKADLISLKE